MAVVLVLPGTAAIGNAASSTSPQTVSDAPQSYYLALGDSMAYGYQPDKASPETGLRRFARVYVDLFAASLRRLSPKIQVVNYGCPGESSVTFTRSGCPGLSDGFRLHDTFRGSQLKAALSFLRTHNGAGRYGDADALERRVGSLVGEGGSGAPAAIASFKSRLSPIIRQLPGRRTERRDHRDRRMGLEADRLARSEHSTAPSTRRSHEPRRRRVPVSRTCSRR